MSATIARPLRVVVEHRRVHHRERSTIGEQTPRRRERCRTVPGVVERSAEDDEIELPGRASGSASKLA